VRRSWSQPVCSPSWPNASISTRDPKQIKPSSVRALTHSHCSKLNAVADHDSFLPPAVDRYHQLLHPTLQLVESVLVTVGATNSDATKQALDFVMHHRETLRILIVESQQLSLSQLKELPLVVGICSYVVPRVPRADLVSRATFRPCALLIPPIAHKGVWFRPIA